MINLYSPTKDLDRDASIISVGSMNTPRTMKTMFSKDINIDNFLDFQKSCNTRRCETESVIFERNSELD